VRLRCLLCGVVGSWGEDDALRVLTPLLRDKQGVVIASAAEVLGRVHKREAVEALLAALKDAKDARAKDDLSFALRQLTKKEFQDALEWSSWWEAEKDKFSFDAKPAEEKPAEGPSALPRTTSDGSGLYERVTSERVCFVIDNSGSMKITGEVVEETKPVQGTGTHSKDPPSPDAKKKTVSRLEYVQKELVNVIDQQLSKRSTFNVIAFASEVVPWRKSLVPATDANKNAAKTWVQALKPTSETNIYGALEAAFADKDVDTIYILTDGFPDWGKYQTTDAICGEVKRWNDTRKVKIHCICYLVGDATKFHVIENKSMSKTFMKRLADESGGTFKCFE
jgi:hypothetical protein